MKNGEISGLTADGDIIRFFEIKCPECNCDRMEPLNRRSVFVDYRCCDCGYEFLVSEIHEMAV